MHVCNCMYVSVECVCAHCYLKFVGPLVPCHAAIRAAKPMFSLDLWLGWSEHVPNNQGFNMFQACIPTSQWRWRKPNPSGAWPWSSCVRRWALAPPIKRCMACWAAVMVMSIAQPQPFGMDCPMHDVHGEVHEDQSGTEWWSHKGLMLVLRMHGMQAFRGWKARGPVASVLPHGTSVLVTDQRGKKTLAVLQEPPGNPQGMKLYIYIYIYYIYIYIYIYIFGNPPLQSASIGIVAILLPVVPTG